MGDRTKTFCILTLDIKHPCQGVSESIPHVQAASCFWGCHYLWVHFAFISVCRAWVFQCSIGKLLNKQLDPHNTRGLLKLIWVLRNSNRYSSQRLNKIKSTLTNVVLEIPCRTKLLHSPRRCNIRIICTCSFPDTYGPVDYIDALRFLHIQALLTAKEALHLMRRNPKALSLVGLVLSHSPEGKEKALKAFTKALAIDPSCSDAVTALAKMYCGTTAVRSCNRFIKQAPGSTYRWLYVDETGNYLYTCDTSSQMKLSLYCGESAVLVVAAAKSYRADLCVLLSACFVQELDFNRKSVDALYIIFFITSFQGQVYALNGDIETALVHYHKALSLTPNYPQAIAGIDRLEHTLKGPARMVDRSKLPNDTYLWLYLLIVWILLSIKIQHITQTFPQNINLQVSLSMISAQRTRRTMTDLLMKWCMSEIHRLLTICLEGNSGASIAHVCFGDKAFGRLLPRGHPEDI